MLCIYIYIYIHIYILCVCVCVCVCVYIYILYVCDILGVTLDADTPAHLLLRREHAALLDEDATHQQHLLHAVTNIWASRGHRLAVAHGVYLYTLAPYPPPRPTA